MIQSDSLGFCDSLPNPNEFLFFPINWDGAIVAYCLVESQPQNAPPKQGGLWNL